MGNAIHLHRRAWLGRWGSIFFMTGVPRSTAGEFLSDNSGRCKSLTKSWHLSSSLVNMYILHRDEGGKENTKRWKCADHVQSRWMDILQDSTQYMVLQFSERNQVRDDVKSSKMFLLMFMNAVIRVHSSALVHFIMTTTWWSRCWGCLRTAEEEMETLLALSSHTGVSQSRLAAASLVLELVILLMALGTSRLTLWQQELSSLLSSPSWVWTW